MSSSISLSLTKEPVPEERPKKRKRLEKSFSPHVYSVGEEPVILRTHCIENLFLNTFSFLIPAQTSARGIEKITPTIKGHVRNLESDDSLHALFEFVPLLTATCRNVTQMSLICREMRNLCYNFLDWKKTNTKMAEIIKENNKTQPLRCHLVSAFMDNPPLIDFLMLSPLFKESVAKLMPKSLFKNTSVPLSFSFSATHMPGARISTVLDVSWKILRNILLYRRENLLTMEEASSCFIVNSEHLFKHLDLNFNSPIALRFLEKIQTSATQAEKKELNEIMSSSHHFTYIREYVTYLIQVRDSEMIQALKRILP